MINVRRLIRKAKYYFGEREKVYNDPTPDGFLRSVDIPDVVFEREVILYTAGINRKLGVYKVIVQPSTITNA